MVTKHQRGFTLVELMVSLVLFSLLVAGVLSVAVSVTQGFREQRQVITTDTQVRAPMDFLGDVIRMASPGVGNGDIVDSVGDASCNYYGLAGYTRVPTPGPTPNTAVVVTNNSPGTIGMPVIGTDSLDVVYASGGVVTSSTVDYVGGNSLSVVDATGIRAGDQLLITNTQQGHILYVTGAPVGNNIPIQSAQACAIANLPGGAGGKYPITSLVIRVVHARFSIYNDQQTNIPGLYVGKFTTAGPPAAYTTPGVWEPVAEGIEDMQIALAQDANGNTIIDAPVEWVFSGGSANAFLNTTAVRGVRITLIGRAASQLTNGPGNLGRPAAEDHAPGPTTDSFRRRVLTSTFETRNLGGSL